MGDIRIVWDQATASGDFAMAGSDLETGHELETAILISLFTDRVADPGDIVPDNDPRGWWADTYATLEDQTLPSLADPIGSKLWQIFVRPRNQDTLNWARDQCAKALAWMLTDGVASAVDVVTAFVGSGGVGVTITISANGVPTVYDYAWAEEV